jgi:hypothetical protein
MATLAVISSPTATDETQQVKLLSGRSWHFESKTHGAGHEVKIRIAADGTPYLSCTCPGGKFAFAGDRTGRGCWAMKTVRAEYGLR